MTLLSTDHVLALAPDATAARAGAALGTAQGAARHWTALGGDGEGRAVWGACRGSGAQPYRTQVALPDLATRCTCPSRKLPCKHALGLLLLLAAEPELFAVAEPPAWVEEWLATRNASTERKGTRRAEPEADDAAQATAARAAAQADRARRAAARARKAAAGLEELSRWLHDLVRGGLAAAGTQPMAFWDTAAARLVDAQLPGAARLVRQLATLPATGDRWPDRLLAAVARLHLLTEAYARLDTLAADLQADVRATLGWPVPADELDALPAVDDVWTVLGQVVEEEDRLRARRTWLAGQHTGRRALLLHFAHGASPFAEAVPPAGAVFAGALAFFPGSAGPGTSGRATVRARHAVDRVIENGAPALPTGRVPVGQARVADATGAWSAALRTNPWTERVILTLGAVVPERRGERWVVRDADGDVLPLAARFRAVWPLAAVAGGGPVWLAGEWDGETLLPLAVADADGAVTALSPNAALVPNAVPPA